MARGQGQKVNRKQLAEIFGMSLPTVDVWVKDGCPFVQRGGQGREWTFDSADVMRWREQRAAEQATGGTNVEEAELKRRKLLSATLLAELEFAEARGLVAPVAEIERAQARMNAVIRQNIMTVPQRVVLSLLGEKDEARFKKVLHDELAQALEKAADAAGDVDEDEVE